MLTNPPYIRLAATAFALIAAPLSACGQPATPTATPAAAPPTATAVPTLNATEIAIAVTAGSTAPTALPTATLDPTQQALFSTVLPTPTGDGSPYPITWRVTPYTTHDGRTAYMVDDRQVLQDAEMVFEKWRNIMAFQDGLPPRSQHEADLVALIDNPAWVKQLLDKYDTWANELTGYWSYPAPQVFGWSDEVAEFSADGSRAAFNVHTPANRIEWHDFESNKVTHVQDIGETLWQVVLRYDTQTGKWMLIGATAKGVESPVVTVTPSK